MAFAIDGKKIAKNTMMLYLRLGITMVISFFTARVTLQQLGVDDYGLNNLVGSVVSLFSFINGSMGTAVQRFYNIEIGRNDEQRLKRVFGVGLYLHLWVASITVLLAEIFAIFFLYKLNIPSNRLFAAHVVFQISIISLALNIVNVPYSALLRSREMFSKMAIVEIVQALLRLCVLYLLVISSFDKLITLSILNCFITFYYVGSLFLMARQFKEAHHRPCCDKSLMRQMMVFVSMLLITVLAELLNTKGLIVLINIYFGLAVNAAFAVAVQVMNLVNSFAINFKQSMVPQMVSSYSAGDKANMFRLINIGTKVTFILMLTISMPVIFASKWLLTLWLGSPPKYSSELVSLVLININVSSFSYFLYQGVHATGKIVAQQAWMSGAYMVNVILVFISFELGYNFYSALYITILISVFRTGVNLFYAWKNLKYDVVLFLNITTRCLFAILVCYSVGLVWIMNFSISVISHLFLVIVMIAISLFTGYTFVLDKEERHMVLIFTKKIINHEQNL